MKTTSAFWWRSGVVVLLLALGPFASGGLSFVTNGGPVSFAVEKVTFMPPSLSPGQTLSVSFRIRNLSSNTPLPSMQVRLRLSSDSVVSELDPGLIPLDVGVPSMGPGGSYNFTGPFTVPGNLLPGTYYVGVFADPNRALNQTNRANNAGMSISKFAPRSFWLRIKLSN